MQFDMKGDCCGMFRALGVGTRVKILEVLKSQGPLGAKRIAEILGVTPAAVSQHLKVLRDAGLVSSERKGYFIPYAIDPGALEKCGRAIFRVCGCMPEGERPAEETRSEGKQSRARQSCRSEMDSLESYRRELERQLEAVRERLDSLKRKGKA